MPEGDGHTQAGVHRDHRTPPPGRASSTSGDLPESPNRAASASEVPANTIAPLAAHGPATTSTEPTIGLTAPNHRQAPPRDQPLKSRHHEAHAAALLARA
jgi:hypothetical protein